MKTVVIANPNAAAKKAARIWKKYERAISDHFGTCHFYMTDGPAAATRIVRQNLSTAQRIVVIGGDGTLGEAINGFYDPVANEYRGHQSQLVYLPAGTACDFARTMGIRELTPLEQIAMSTEQFIDVGRLDMGGTTHHFINIASIGSSALIVKKVNAASKRLGGKLSFMMGTLRGLSQWKNTQVRLRVDNDFDEVVSINTIAIANGRYFGGGMMISPDALPNDGLLNVVVIGDIGVTTYIRHGRRLYRGTHADLPYFTFLKGRKICIEAVDQTQAIPIEADGEEIGDLPLKCTVLPKALRLFSPPL